MGYLSYKFIMILNDWELIFIFFLILIKKFLYYGLIFNIVWGIRLIKYEFVFIKDVLFLYD